MANTLMDKIAKLLSVELGEAFEIKGQEGQKFRLDDTYGLVSVHSNWDDIGADNSKLFIDLLTGVAEIAPWKPRNGEMYWFYGIDGHLAYDAFKTASALCLYRFASGNCFESPIDANKSEADIKAKIMDVKKRLCINAAEGEK